MLTRLIIPLIASASALAASDQPNEIRVLSIDLPEAIRLTLAKNFLLAEQSFTPRIAARKVQSASGKFDPTISASYSYGLSRQQPSPLDAQAPPISQILTPTPNSTFQTSTQSASTSLSGLLPTGTSYDLGPSTTWDADDRRDSPFTRYNSFLGLSITQPLLRNFGTDVNLAEIRIARADYATSAWQLRSTAINLVTECIKTYSELCFAIENLAVELRSRQLSATLLSDNIKRAEIGVMAPLDVLQARADLAAREERVLVATRALADYQNFLKQLITDETAGLLDLQIQPSPPKLPPLSPSSRQQDFAKAFQLRPDYRQAILEIQKRKINLAFARNQALPRLDLETSLGLNGLDSSLANSLARTISNNPQNLYFDISATLSLPIPNNSATAETHAARLSVAQALISLKRLEQQILVEADNAAGQIETTAKRIQAASLARELAQKSLEAAQARLASGTTTTFEVLQLQRDLANAEASELRARADHIIALAEFAKATGTTLERFQITFDPTPSTQKKQPRNQKLPKPNQ